MQCRRLPTKSLILTALLVAAGSILLDADARDSGRIETPSKTVYNKAVAARNDRSDQQWHCRNARRH